MVFRSGDSTTCRNARRRRFSGGICPGRRCRLAAGVFLPLVVSFAGSAAGADWPQWRGPKRDATTSEEITLWPPKRL